MRRSDYSKNNDLTLFQKGAGVGLYCLFRGVEAQIKQVRLGSDEVLLAEVVHNYSERQATGQTLWTKRQSINPIPKEKNDERISQVAQG